MSQATLRQQRGIVRGAVTRVETFLSKATQGNVKRGDVIERAQRLRETWSEFHKLHDEILNQIWSAESPDQAAIDAEEDVLADYENSYYSLIGNLEELIEQLTPATTASSSNTSHQSPGMQASNGTPTATTGNKQFLYKLPTLSLPKFDGSIANWTTFKDAFESMIHADEHMAPVHKFAYLRDSLVGPAARMIHSLKTSDANYVVAWKGLCDRFENKKLIIDTHLNSLWSIKQLEKESGIGLRDFVDEFNKHIGALETLCEPSLDTLLIHLCSSKLDTNSKDKWEEYRLKKEKPTFDDLIQFLNERCQILESRCPTIIDKSANKSKNIRTSSLSVTKAERKCYKCGANHSIYTCREFLALTVSQRVSEANKLKLCPNCLVRGHDLSTCRSRSCKHCSQRHNSLLHEDSSPSPTASPVNACTSSSYSRQPTRSVVLLATAVLTIADSRGNLHKCRALLDSGSQSNFITQSLADKLQINMKKIHMPLHGIGNNLTHIKGKIRASIESLHDRHYKTELEFLCIPEITQFHPQVRIDPACLVIPQNITLADPQFHEPRGIDMLIGAATFWDLLCIGQFKSEPHGVPVFQKTRLGWVVSGDVSLKAESANTSCHLTLRDQVAQFWELEQITTTPEAVLSPEHRRCEAHYRQTTVREADGRYVVRLPFNDNLDQLGSSKQTAERRLLSLERRLLKDAELKTEYTKFMQDYLDSGHMKLIEYDDGRGYYLPHHAVRKEDSTTTKVRVVFDASSKTTSQLSLNDVLLCGPTIQNSLFDLLIRFRLHRYVLTADVKQMYRQVKVDPEDTIYQKILWRQDPTEPMQTFQLQTVTYGTTSAPYQAVRTLHEIVKDEGADFPLASTVVQRDFYVDDCLTGTNTIEELLQVREELQQLLQGGQFQLRKWQSNSEAISADAEAVPLHRNQSSKTLGLIWTPSTDEFSFSKPRGVCFQYKFTKRMILSQLSQVFDPLGLLGPITVTAKVIIQKLWQSGIHWDTSVPMEIFTQWNNYVNELDHINTIAIPRWAGMITATTDSQLHGFCDASQRAYGAAVYLRTTHSDDHTVVRLLASKSRVAPLKVQTLPRLELCGAVLLAHLMTAIEGAMTVPPSAVHYWTDSTIVLSWIAAESTHYQTFVANRMSDIQTLTSPSQWHHVPGTMNPADLVSRGATPVDLRDNPLWWSGPDFLARPTDDWPKFPGLLSDPLEERKMKAPVTLTAVASTSTEVLERVTQLRSLAYILRWKHNAGVPKAERLSGPVTTAELDAISTRLVRQIQEETFNDDINALRLRGQTAAHSPIRRLNPFIDEEGILRVGGRLHHSHLPYQSRHPAIIPGKHRFTELLVQMIHEEHLHGGPRLVLNALRQRYWPIHGMTSVKRYVKKCVKCCRTKPTTFQPLMGSLPRERLNPGRPFTHVGLDFAGPFLIKPFRTRGSKAHKSYLCIFVCFASKAVHLEVAVDLSADAFLHCLHRFVSRRGKPATLHSDNGTNFRGADNALRQVINRLLVDHRASQWASERAIEWRFIPPNAPHMGGLWEAAVKSAKAHLQKTIGSTTLSYDEWMTLLCQIEAVMNSRPLTPLSEDPRDLDALTPGHFLIGTPLTALPEDDVQAVPTNRLDYYQHVTNLKQIFWRRWSLDYLNQLQGRTKWTSHGTSPHVGQLVVIKARDIPACAWSLGRIEEIYPGVDGITRTVLVKTSKGVIKSAVRNLCPLPVQDN